MKDQEKTKEQLVSELAELRKEYNSLKKSSETQKQKDKILLHTIINNLPSSVFVKDKEFRKTLANKAHLSRMCAHLKSLGLDPRIDIIGKTDFEVTPLELSEEYFADDKKVIQFGESILNKEESGYNPNGEPINQIVTKVPLLDYIGEIIGMIGITTDITELRLAGEEIKIKNKQLIKSNAEKDKFFSIIAHDLRSPFNSILGFCEMIIEEVEAKNLDKVEEYANIILKSASRAVDLLMNLMYWAQSQTGGIKFNPINIVISDLFEEVLVLFEDIARQKNIIIDKDLPDNLIVSVDKAMIATVLRNLISNAIKFTHSGGKIVISTELVENMLLISVRDNGVGIPKEVIDKLFKTDESHSTLGTKNEKGTGLGLVLCKEFAENHHGKIWAESELGKGSVFKFSLPLAVY
ncbi:MULTISPECIES: PAS domain-containing sensor histidine kinase [unclassified Lentimicrobium]|uniref:sensor histidine kinase n=1 Tax=unclassified Lentimicrobium TaxID=2677434 RepID=UPI0015561A6C|nr:MULTISPECIES: PAS domain-containing sensor histidine kinase [unclassified Lentimicrobium]NPD47082.1 PAS domain-containing protein [Lentimicrobium sp. S6]NPD85730.1 PAS domain-containing protein [Lentimicrobium sp. L6]